MVLSRNYGSIGDFRAAQQILSLNSDPKLAVLKFAHEFTTADAKRDSLVLIGSQASNPWVSLFADKLNFAMQYDFVKRKASVMNRSVQPGEEAVYAAPDSPVFGASSTTEHRLRRDCLSAQPQRQGENADPRRHRLAGNGGNRGVRDERRRASRHSKRNFPKARSRLSRSCCGHRN